ncbi:MAG: PGPGW domain-containing protein [Ignavibacteriaceae bacterium]
MRSTIKGIRKLIVGIVGFTILFIGLLLIFLPGPAFIIIPAGLGILATEFVWARNLLTKFKEKFKKKK